MQVMVNLLKQLFSYLEKKYQSIRSTYLLSWQNKSKSMREKNMRSN
jgi:hypothetical protein